MKKVLISFFVVGVIISLGIVSSKYFNNDENLISDKTLISYYVETGEGTGVYEKQEGTTWPEGYVLNEEKSSCDNGSTLSWDSSTNSVVVTASKEDNCKVYMDKSNQLIIEGYDNAIFNIKINNVFIDYSINNQKVIYNIGDNIHIFMQNCSTTDSVITIYNKENQILATKNFERFDYMATFDYIFTGNEYKIVIVSGSSLMCP